ncbi:MAG TPA: UDP-N-acetylmuramate--L-alanine ligase [Bacteroidales bacterium]|nr:UDP-N-acetylmuramate--L-alanine ligase [Bacteroidales bacterium]
MIDFKDIEGVYFVGIGGIGMSAIALYFIKGGFSTGGYDRSAGRITANLSEQGCSVTYKDDTGELPELFTNPDKKNRVLIVYTPAIPAENRILSFFRDNGYNIYKRSEILGIISSNTNTLAVSGTHGKTTVSTMTAHLLKQSHVDCSAFLGGISKNYDSNLLLGESNYTVIEADEFDRSFHRLSPLMAVITSVDADHLDIYGDHKTMIEAYNIFAAKIKRGGKLVVNKRIISQIIKPEGVDLYTYGFEEGSDFHSFDIKHLKDYYSFSVKTPSGVIKDIHFPFPGIINVENLTAAIALATLCGVEAQEIRKGAMLFQGVRRRFDIRYNDRGLTYVDDYAHHPEEIKAFIKSIKEYFGGRKLTGIFQPHLFTRTRDHADGFAAILDELDEAILLPVYPAREKPIEGVSSEMILERMKSPGKRLIEKDQLLAALDVNRLDVLLTIGAGDIDSLVIPIEEKIKRDRKG